MGAKWLRRWDGGRVRAGRGGEEVFVLECMTGGQRFAITLDVATEREARGELALFGRDPIGYAEAHKARRLDQLHGLARVVLDAAAVDAFAPKGADQLGGEEKSHAHAAAVRLYLLEWAKVLGDRDFRRVTLADFDGALRAWKRGRHHRIVALRSWTAWMRSTGKLKGSEDPSLALKVPPVVAAKGKKRKAPALADAEKVYSAINPPPWTGLGPRPASSTTQAIRDTFLLAAKYGLHATEIRRIAEGLCELRKVEGQGEIAGTVAFPHKSGDQHRISLDAQSYAAAERLLQRGEVPSGTYVLRTLKRAAKAAGVAPVLLGQLRAGFVTWASERARVVRPSGGTGATLDEISLVTGHSPATARKFYRDVQIPAMLITGIRLQHRDDPPAPPVPRATPKKRAG